MKRSNTVFFDFSLSILWLTLRLNEAVVMPYNKEDTILADGLSLVNYMTDVFNIKVLKGKLSALQTRVRL